MKKPFWALADQAMPLVEPPGKLRFSNGRTLSISYGNVLIYDAVQIGERGPEQVYTLVVGIVPKEVLPVVTGAQFEVDSFESAELEADVSTILERRGIKGGPFAFFK